MGAQQLGIASRGSPLALAQVEEALEVLQPLFADTAWNRVVLSSPGDRDTKIDLTDPSVPDDFFTRDVDQAILQGRADLSVHSAKDLPEQLHPELEIAALLPAQDIRDALVFRKDLDLNALPKTVGTSSPRRSEALKKMFPDTTLKPIRGTIAERIEKTDLGEYDAVIIAACALHRLGWSDRISHYLAYDPAPQQGRLAIVVRKDREDLLNRLKKLDVRQTAGLVALVGCPADSALLSDRARQYLRQADIIYHDRLLPDEILLEIRNKAVAVGKAGGHPSIAQADIHRSLLHEAEKGHLIVRLHGGDPCIYGHLAEELEFLTDWDLRTEVITAPSAAQIASSHAWAPLTHRETGGRISFIAGHEPGEETPGEWPGPGQGNLAVYMGMSNLDQNRERLLKAGWPEDTPVLVAQRVGYRDEAHTRTTLDGLSGKLDLQTPAVMLLGLRSFPSKGFTLFVGTDPEHFLNYGPILHWPLIRLVSRPVEERVQCLRERLEQADGIFLASRFSVRCFIEALMHWKDTRALAGKKLLAVGPATSDELASFGLKADGAADSLGGIQTLSGMLTDDFKGTFFYPCSHAAPRKERVEALRGHGVELDPAVFYMNRKIEYKTFPQLPVSRVLFTSTSSVRYYFELYPGEQQSARTWLAVGPSTLKALQQLGLKAEVIED